MVPSNTAPSVNGLSLSTSQDGNVSITLMGSDGDGDDLTFSIVSDPMNGSLGMLDNSASAMAIVIYTPNPGFVGIDSFTFRAGDGDLFSNTATVIIETLMGPSPQPMSLALSWSTYVGGGQGDFLRDIAIDGAGNVYVAGGTQSSSFPVTAGTYDTTFNVGGTRDHDVFVMKFSPDGQLIWSTFVGGPNYDRAYALEVDAAGFVYIGGRAGPGFPTTPGSAQPNFAGDNNPNPIYDLQDGFVAKLSPDGQQLLWSTYFGGGDRSFIRDIDIDDAGNVYLAMTAASVTNPFVGPGAAIPSLQGANDGVIAKISADGSNVLWATYVGGSDGDLGTPSIRVDGAGQAYVLGLTSSADVLTTPNAFDRTYNGKGDLFLVKVAADGTDFLFATYLGGSNVDFSETHGLALDAQGNVYVGATTKSSNFPTTSGTLQPNYGGSGNSSTGGNSNYPGDGVISLLSADGSTMLASTFLGGSGGEGLEGVAVDAAGNVYAGGASFSTNFPITSDAAQSSLAGKADCFMVKLSADLSEMIYGTYFGGSERDFGRTLMVDPAGAAYFGGNSKSTDWPILGAIQTNATGGWDGVLVRIGN